MANTSDIDIKLDALKSIFYNNAFPFGVIHEFVAAKPEDIAATSGFIAGILPSLMMDRGITIWIGATRTIFPPALQSFGIAPDKIIFIDLQKEKEILWAMEEALKCDGLAAVIGEVKDLSFTASRRLQLAVEQSHVTGFVLRLNSKNLNTNACFTRWKITSLPSGNHLPGVNFPRWNAELLKVRNGKPCTLQIEFTGGRFMRIYKTASIPQQQKRKPDDMQKRYIWIWFRFLKTDWFIRRQPYTKQKTMEQWLNEDSEPYQEGDTK